MTLSDRLRELKDYKEIKTQLGKVIKTIVKHAEENFEKTQE